MLDNPIVEQKAIALPYCTWCHGTRNWQVDATTYCQCPCVYWAKWRHHLGQFMDAPRYETSELIACDKEVPNEDTIYLTGNRDVARAHVRRLLVDLPIETDYKWFDLHNLRDLYFVRADDGGYHSLDSITAQYIFIWLDKLVPVEQATGQALFYLIRRRRGGGFRLYIFAESNTIKQRFTGVAALAEELSYHNFKKLKASPVLANPGEEQFLQEPPESLKRHLLEQCHTMKGGQK